MNYQYTIDELQSYDRDVLLQISNDYHLTISENDDKLAIIKKIITHQNKFTAVAKLPADIPRLLALYLNICDLIKFNRLNSNNSNIISNNQIFLRNLVQRRLKNKQMTDDQLIGDKLEIFREIYYQEKTNHPLINAASKGDLKTLKYLFKPPVFVNIHVYNDAALRAAVDYGHPTVTKYLISQGANIHANDDEALRTAAAQGRLPMVKYLLSQDADVHACNDMALQNATYNGHLKIVEILVSNGANIHRWDEHPLILPASGRHGKVGKYLLSKGANVVLEKPIERRNY